MSFRQADYEHEIPGLSTEQMIEVDRAMIEEYGIELIQMMESAGRNLAHLARRRFLEKDPRGKCVIVLAGRGNNGGGAMVCARRLAIWGARVALRLTRSPEEFQGVPLHQLRILERMGVPVALQGSTEFSSPAVDANLVIDGLIGYSLSGPPHGSAADLIQWANQHAAPTLALDTPSGLDTATGKVMNPAIEATATMTLALPKRGLRSGIGNVGELYLADISIPPDLYERFLGLQVGALFAHDDIIRLDVK